jgi:hypothetical protein
MEAQADAERQTEQTFQEPSEEEIEARLHLMTWAARLIDVCNAALKVHYIDAWFCRKDLEDVYLEADHWLMAHGINYVFDRTQQKYIPVLPPQRQMD